MNHFELLEYELLCPFLVNISAGVQVKSRKKIIQIAFCSHLGVAAVLYFIHSAGSW